MAPRHQQNAGIADLEGFAESLRLLAEREEYSAVDVALMFGVSKERIRQLSKRYGIVWPRGRGLYAERVWDDATNRFYPVSRGTMTEVRRHRVSASRSVLRRMVCERTGNTGVRWWLTSQIR